jgi:hypothetical protein
MTAAIVMIRPSDKPVVGERCGERAME